MTTIIDIFTGRDTVSLIVCISFSSILFILGLVGTIYNKRNLLVFLICIEIMFFSVGLNFIFFGLLTNNMLGQIYCLFIVTMAAAETVIGLSLFIVSYRLSNKISYDSLTILRG
jgi:NADH-quinone oxidoreductase subunit K